ncbi:hypothetical protein [Streptomyces virginiae]|uniref:hypothetical protein n=1 Tax=Streptomyces virginiae TaxID=1961 RepID=UPI00224D0877|nr:hypothetical protein [Streptomyces virginiae]MCX4962973.1 hypothetical protein [Streptomyces virginiae]
MDQGVAAIWAAGIGVFGVVATAGGALWAAHKTAAAQIAGAKETAAAQIAGAREQAAAQVDAALAGVQAQLSGQRQESLWQVRREAYATYLGQIQAVHMGILHLTSLCMVAIEQLGGSPGEAPDLIGPRDQLIERFTDLYFRESALHLAVDEDEAEQAEALRRLAGRAIEDVRDLMEAIYTDHNVGPPQDRAEASREALKTGIRDWAANARQKLSMVD